MSDVLYSLYFMIFGEQNKLTREEGSEIASRGEARFGTRTLRWCAIAETGWMTRLHCSREGACGRITNKIVLIVMRG